MNKPPVFRPHSPADVSLYIEDKKPRRGISCEDDYSGFGRLAFTDPDAGDTHRVSVAFKPRSGASSPLGALSARVRRDGAHGRVGWRFSIDRDAVAFLGAGETYSEIFTISLADSAGNIARQDVAVTLIGANDAPRIFWRAGDVFERRLTETSGSPSPGALLSAGGAFHFLDPDKMDLHVVSATFDAHDSSGHRPLGALTLSQPSDGAFGGTVAWAYRVDAARIEFLGQGAVYTETFTVRIADAGGATVRRDVTVHIVGTNDAPVLVHPLADQTATPGHSFRYRLPAGSFADIDAGDRLTLSAVLASGAPLPSWLHFDARTGVFTGTPPAGAAGFLDVRVTAKDAHRAAANDIFRIKFPGAANMPATIGVPPVSNVREDVAVDPQGKLIAAGMLPVSDPDAGQAAFQTAVAPVGSPLGALTLAVDGAYVYSVDNSAVQYLGAGQAQIDRFTVKSLDGTTKIIAFTIRGANDRAVIGDPSVASVTEDVSVDLNGELVAAGTLSVSDPDAGQASFLSAVAPVGTALGALTLAANGAYVYSVANASVQYLNAGQTKIDRFIVKSLDGTAKIIAFTVHGADEPTLALTIDAIAGDDLLSFPEGHAAAGVILTGAVSGLAPGSTLTVRLDDGGFSQTYFATLSANGASWSATIPRADASGLANGAGVVSIFASDALGHTSAPVQRGFAVNETSAPVFGLATSDAVGANATKSAAVTLVGHTDPGDAVTLLSTGATTIASTDGSFSFSQVALPLGDADIVLQASNASGVAASSLTVHRLPPDVTPDMAIQWNRIAQQAIASDASNAEFASRALTIESLAVYDAVNAINGRAGYLTRHAAPAGADARTAAAQAAHDALAALYPAQRLAFDALLAQSLAPLPDGQGKIDGVALGSTIAAEILTLRARDGWNAFVIDDGSPKPGKWRPTGPAFMPAQNPQWGAVTPFALVSADQFAPAAPPDVSSQAYADAVNEVKALGASNSATRTADQTIIAKFWNDGVGTYTPPGQWNSIADQTALAAGGSLSANARLLAELNVAEADAAIAAWSAKFTYDVWRPISAIQFADQAPNTGVQPDANWAPLVNTPNFPSYVSGHSTFSAAAAEILASFFGADFSFSYTDPALGSLAGVTRSFTSFWQAAQEAGQSRVYAGIHYSFDNVAGLALGRQVGDWTLGAFDASVDFVPPTIVIDGASGGVGAVAPIVTGHVIDALSGVAHLLAWYDDQPAQAVNFDAATGAFSFAPVVGADGVHSVRFTAVDATGYSTLSSAFGFTVDTLAPVVALAGTSVHSADTLAPGARLTGGAVDAGSALTALSYAFDGGAALPLAFNSAGAFDAALSYGALSVGAHTLTITARDSAGNVGTQTLNLTVATPPPLTLTGVSPADMAMEVGVTFRPRVAFSRAVDVATLTNDAIFVTDSSGARVAATLKPFADGTGAWLLFPQALPGASGLTLHVDGSKIADAQGVHLDAAGAGVAGSTFSESFTTVSTTIVPGTSLSGQVVDPGPDLTPMTPDDVKAGPLGLNDFAHDTWKLPIVHARVYVLGHEDKAVFTDADGRFLLTDAPTGDVKVEFDGTTATNAPPGFYFPVMVMDVNAQPGIDNTIMGGMGSTAAQNANAANPAVYLPRLETAILTPLSSTQTTIITAPLSSTGSSGLNLTPEQASEIKLVVQPGSLVDENGAPVLNAQVGLATVPSALVMDMLPPGVLQHSFDITIQAPGGAVFTTPAQLTLPNVEGLAPGAKTYVLSFDHTTGRLVIDGTATVSADGKTVVTDPGSGIIQPGWHDIVEGTEGDGEVRVLCGQPPANAPAPSVGDYVDATTNLVGHLDTANNLFGAATGAKAPIGPLAAVSSLVADKRSIDADFDELLKDDGAQTSGFGPVDTSYRLIMGFKLAGDIAKTSVDSFGAIVGNLPFFKGTSMAKAADGLSLSISVADNFGQWTANGTIFQPVNDLEQKLTDSENAMKPTVAWKPPPVFKLPIAIAHLNATIAQVVLNDQQRSAGLSGMSAALGAIRGAIAGWNNSLPLGGVDFPTAKALKASIGAAMDALSAGAGTVAQLPSEQDDVEAVLKDLQSMYDAYAEDTGMKLTNMALNADGGVTPIKIEQTPEQEIPQTLYAAIKNLTNGDVQRTQFAADQGLSYFLAADTWYRISVYDPVTKEAGDVVFKSGASGAPTHIPDIMLHTDDSAAYSNGLTLFASYVVGVIPDIPTAATAPPNRPDNLVPGVTDQQALTQALVGSARSALATGIVASALLRGEADAVTLATSGTNGGRTLAYVATGSYGLAVVDVSNARNPVTLSQLQLNGGGAVGVAVDAALGIAAVAQGAGGVSLIDVSDPLNPRLLRTLASATAPDVAIRDGRLFTLNNNGQMQTYDLATGNILQAELTGFGALAALTLDGSTLYTLNTAGTLATWDVSSGTATYLGQINLLYAFNPALISTFGNHVYAADGIVYIGSGGNASSDVGGYLTINASDPTNPLLIAGYGGGLGLAGAAIALNGSGLGVGVQHIQDSTQPGNRGDVLDVFNTADLSNTHAFVTRFRLPGAPGDVEIANGQAYVADGAAGLQIVSYKALDTAGVAPTVAIVRLPATIDPQAPGLELYEGQPFALGVSVTDDVQVARVELLVNGRVVKTDLSYPWTLSGVLPSILANGSPTVTLSVRATDTGGNVAVSAPVLVTLAPNPAAFTLTSVTPADGTQVQLGQHVIALSFSRSVDPATISAADFTLTNGLGATLAPQSIAVQGDGRRVTLIYDAAALAVGAYALDIDAAAIKDNVGVALGASVFHSAFTVSGAFTTSWTSLIDGDWLVAENWSGGALPGGADNVLMSITGGTTATFRYPYSPGAPAYGVGNLTVGGLGALAISPYRLLNGFGQFVANNSTLSVAQDVVNSGRIVVAGGELAVGATLHNSGLITIDGVNDSGVGASLGFSNGATGLIEDGGRIKLVGQTAFSQVYSNKDSLRIDPSLGLSTVENVDNVISGAGRIGGNVFSLDYDPVRQRLSSPTMFINDAAGVIHADGQDYILINSGTLKNHGLIEATGGANVDVTFSFGFRFSQLLATSSLVTDSDGVFLADGANSGINFVGAYLDGGTYQSKNGGTIAFEKGFVLDSHARSPVVLDGTTSAVRLIGADANTLGNVFVGDETQAKGAIFNHSRIYLPNTGTVNAQGDFVLNNSGYLGLAGDMTLTGKGEIQIARAGDAFRHNLDVGIVADTSSGGMTFDNVDNFIHGKGVIGSSSRIFNPAFGLATARFTLKNGAQGRIVADAQLTAGDDANASRLDLVNLDIVNRGRIEATGSGGLLISNATIDNTGGVIAADTLLANYAILDASSVSGGVVAADGGTMVVQGSAVVGAMYQASQGGSFQFYGVNDASTDIFQSSNGVNYIVLTENASLTATDAIYGLFEIDLYKNTSLTVNDRVDAGATIAFKADNATAVLDVGPTPGFVLQDFHATDTIDLLNFDAASAVVDGLIGDDLAPQIDVTDALGHKVHLDFVYNAASGLISDQGNVFFSLGDDGHGGVLLTNNVGAGGGGLTPGEIVNGATISIGPGLQPDILINQDTRLRGGGRISLQGGAILTDGSVPSNTPVTFFNHDNTIYTGPGMSGTIGDASLLLDNEGALGLAGDRSVILSGGDIVIAAAGTRNEGDITAVAGGTIHVFNDIDNFFGQGSISAQSGGSIKIDGQLHGDSQNNTILAGSRIEAGLVQDGRMNFLGDNAVFVIDSITTPGFSGGTMSGFFATDQLDLRDLFGASATLSYAGDTTGGTLTVLDGAHSVGVSFLGDYTAAGGSPSASHFSVAVDSSGGALISTDIARV